MKKAYDEYLKKLEEKVIETEPLSDEDYQAMIDKGQIKIKSNPITFSPHPLTNSPKSDIIDI